MPDSDTNERKCMSNEQTVGIAHKMYECRRTLRRLFSSNYQAQVIDYMRAVNAFAEKHGIQLMQASLRLAKGMQESGHDIGVMWVLAATVELCEPDEQTPALECVGK